MLGEICQFSNTIVTKFCPTSSPGFGMHRLQVTVCCSSVHNICDHGSCGNDFSTCVQVLLFSSHFSNSFMWDCLDVALNIYFVLSALLTSDEVAFILITVVKSPFGHKIMFRVNQISEPGVALTSILDKLSWARMPGDLSSNGFYSA